MSIDNLVEDKITQFLELVELITEGFNWSNESENQLESLKKTFEEFDPHLKSIANLYPDRRIRGTPAPQLYEFLNKMFVFIEYSLGSFRTGLLKIFQEISTGVFNLITTESRLSYCLNLLSSLQLPDFDYKFSRFFYHQILPYWLSVDNSTFDPFITQVQKLSDTVPHLINLFQPQVPETLQKDQLPSSITPSLDSLENLMIIIPQPFDSSLKSFMINYLTLINEYRIVIASQFQINQLKRAWMTKGLFISAEFDQNLENQITLLESLLSLLSKKEENQLVSLGINVKTFETTLKDRQELLATHKQLLSLISNVKWDNSASTTLDTLSINVISLLERLKDFSIDLLPEEFQKLVNKVINTHLIFVEWWKNEAKQALLHQLQLPGIITEPLQIPRDERFVKEIKELASGPLRSFFSVTQSKNIHDFLIQFDTDFLPVLTEFQNSHKSVLNALGDLRNWAVVRTLKVIDNGKAIMNALHIFFSRWGEGPLAKTIDHLVSVYNNQFTLLYSKFDNIYLAYSKSTATRFTKPNEAMEQLGIGKNAIQDVKPLITELFPSNPEFLSYITKTQITFQVNKLIIKYLDTPTIDLIDQLALGWDSVLLNPKARLLKEQLTSLENNLTPEIMDYMKSNIRIVNSLIKLVEIIYLVEDYWIDLPLDVLLRIDIAKQYFELFVPLFKGLHGFQHSIPKNRLQSAQTILTRVKEVPDKLAPKWLMLQKRIITFLNSQKSGSILERKTRLEECLEGTKIDLSLKLSFGWQNYVDIIEKLSKEFFPAFKSNYIQWLTHENNWHIAIRFMGSDQAKMEKKWSDTKKKLEKELEELLGLDLEGFYHNFGKRLRDNIEERILVVRESSDIEAPVARMKGLNIANMEDQSFGLL
ncbi:MAG: hypothetical protein ACXAC7_10950 [Candidatus Hodarchaeales archaeon]|jgi:hypothetical protein